jgi:anti-sigma factor RsiW
LGDKVLAAEYRLALPDEKTLVAEVERTQAAIERRIPEVGAKKVPPTAKKARRKGEGK